MADQLTNSNAPLTEEAFLLDRQRMYGLFGNFTFYGTTFVVILLILLAVFLG